MTVFLLFKLCYFNCGGSWGGFIWAHLVLNCLCFQYLSIHFLLYVWEILSHNFSLNIWSPYFSPLLLGPLLCIIGHMLHIILQILHIVLFFPHLCLLFQLYDFHYSVLQITYCSSVSYSLISIVSGLIFISAIELSIFELFVFIVSSSLLHWSAFSINNLNSFSIFITSFLISEYNRLWGLLYYLFFQLIPLILLILVSLSAFSFYLTFSVSLNLEEIVICYCLEGVLLCESVSV